MHARQGSSLSSTPAQKLKTGPYLPTEKPLQLSFPFGLHGQGEELGFPLVVCLL